jgi:hypothetical protein
MLTLDTLLTSFGLDKTRRIKLVRHQNGRLDINRLFRSKQLDIYQSIQSRPAFGDAEILVSFIGQPGTHALFVGVYNVNGVTQSNAHDLPEDYIYPEMGTKDKYKYDLIKDPRFESLQGRLVIDWGTGTRSWVQHFKSKEVVEVLPTGYVSAFPGYMNVMLAHDQLVDIVNNPLPHRDWHQMLKSAAGVYLILDTNTGQQYIGSAYGASGLLGRWNTYAQNGHGGNLQLIDLLKERPNAVRDLQFSILQTLPSTLTKNEVIAYEGIHKRKLGTRAHGLNSN